MFSWSGGSADSAPSSDGVTQATSAIKVHDDEQEEEFVASRAVSIQPAQAAAEPPAAHEAEEPVVPRPLARPPRPPVPPKRSAAAEGPPAPKFGADVNGGVSAQLGAFGANYPSEGSVRVDGANMLFQSSGAGADDSVRSAQLGAFGASYPSEGSVRVAGANMLFQSSAAGAGDSVRSA